MASEMATGSELLGSCIEGITVDVGLKMLKLSLLRLAFFGGWIKRLDGLKLRLFRWQWCHVSAAD